MVHHVRGLPRLNGQEPSTYVKVYLQPDADKSTKRKTKVVKRNCHPCFMEMVSNFLFFFTGQSIIVHGSEKLIKFKKTIQNKSETY